MRNATNHLPNKCSRWRKTNSSRCYVCFDRRCHFPSVRISPRPHFNLTLLRPDSSPVPCESPLTVLSREAVAKIWLSVAQAQSQMIRPCDLSAAIGTNSNAISKLTIQNFIENSPPVVWNSKSRQDRSLDTDKTNLSSGLNAIRVTVNECPSRG